MICTRSGEFAGEDVRVVRCGDRIAWAGAGIGSGRGGLHWEGLSQGGLGGGEIEATE